MSKKLYEEALADVKKLKEVAESNAQRAVLDAVTPRIRDLIEKQLFLENAEEDDGDFGFVPPGGSNVVPHPVATDVVVSPAVSAAITPPDEEGKVTLDIDALCADPAGEPVSPPVFGAPLPDENEYEINMESVDALRPVLSATKSSTKAASNDLELQIFRLGETIQKFKHASALVRESTGYLSQITQMISHVEDMYDYVQESVTDAAQKNLYETKLEENFKVLSKLQEPMTMSKRNKNTRLNEADVTLKLTGMPDDLDLDAVGVDLVTGEEEEGLEGSGEEGGELDLDGLDLGGDEGSEDHSSEGEEDMGESRRLSDDTIVEIDEKMLRREIARMKSLREETKPAAWGDGVGTKEMDDFGGGKKLQDALDDDMPDQSPSPGALPLGEADEDLDEQDQLDEDDDLDEQDDQDMDESDDQDLDQSVPMTDDSQPYPGVGSVRNGAHGLEEDDMALDQIGNRRKEDEFGTDVSDKHYTGTWDKRKHESLRRRISFEKNLQERAKRQAKALKKEAAAAKSSRNARRFNEAKKAYARLAKRFSESVARTKKFSKLMVESTRRLQSESRSNSGSGRSAESKTVGSLRNKLAETNLFNAKLLYTNKLLQNESLSAKQKSQIIRRLDTAKTLREVKLVYESLSETLAGNTRPLRENADRKVIGSSSRVTAKASTPSLNEGVETDRWAKLAGIVK